MLIKSLRHTAIRSKCAKCCDAIECDATCCDTGEEIMFEDLNEMYVLRRKHDKRNGRRKK